MARPTVTKLVTTRRALGALLLLAPFFGAASPFLHAQVSGGTITGEITDASGAAVNDAKIDIVSDTTNSVQHVASHGAGNFTEPNVNPGNYTLTITASGFTTQKVHVIVQLSKDTVVTVALPIAGSTQQVEVSGTVSPIVDTGSSSLNQVVDGKTTRELPLNGRDWTMLSVLEPNVHTTDNQLSISSGDNSRANRGVGTQITVAGTRPQQNVYRLDGIITNDYSGAGPGGALGGTLGVDAIQEFSVVTSNSTADFGRTSGGTISAVTRAGGNQFHGSAYEFIRNSALDAKNYFSNGVTAPFKRNQFGGTVGGPILKNRLFFFFNYEGLRQSRTTAQQTTVPSPNARQGYLVCTQNATASNSGCLASIGGPKAAANQQGVQLVSGGINANVAPYIQFFPVPNLSVNGDTGTWTFNSSADATENLFTGRLDYTIGSKDSIHLTALNDSSIDTQPDAYDFIITGLQPDRKLYSLNEQHTFSSSIVNFARIGYAYTFVVSPASSVGINPLSTDPTYGFVPGYPIGNLAISGLTSFYGGVNTEGLYSYHYNSYQAGDDVYVTKGRHSMQFGASFEAIQSNNRGTSTAGYYQFNSYTAFLQNAPSTFTSAVPGANVPIYMRDKVFGFYAQDAWHVRSNLVLNLGVRYEPTSNLSEAKGHFSRLLLPTDPTPQTGHVLFQNPTLTNIAPRVGIAWDPFSNGKTSVRAAYGIYDSLPLPFMFILSTLNVYPYSTTISVTNTATLAGTFPKQTYLNAVDVAANKVAYVQQDPHRPYVEQYIFNVQQQIAKGTSLEVGYTGAHGIRQPTKANDGNIVEPTNPSDIHHLVWPTVSQYTTTNTVTGVTTAPKFNPFTAPKIDPTAGQTDTTYFNQSTTYNALNASLRHNTANTRIGITYTWAKSLDESSSSNGGSNFTNTSTIAPFPREIGAFKGLSDFNVASNLAVNVLYIIPGPKSSGFLHYAANGWQIGGIGRSATGLPFTALISGDALGLSSASTFDYPDRLRGNGCDGNPVNLSDKFNYLKRQCFAYPQGLNRVTTTSTSGTTLTTTTAYNPTFGNEQRNSIIGPGIQDIDLSLVKTTDINKIREGFHVEFRAEFFNILNHPMFQVPSRASSAVFTATGLTTAPQVLTASSVPERQIQFGLKLIF